MVGITIGFAMGLFLGWIFFHEPKETNQKYKYDDSVPEKDLTHFADAEPFTVGGAAPYTGLMDFEDIKPIKRRKAKSADEMAVLADIKRMKENVSRGT